MKGLIFTGGTVSRLLPATNDVIKQLFPIYYKPMIYYSHWVLMLVGINNLYFYLKQQEVQILERFITWLDKGTHETLVIANKFIKAIEKRTNRKIGCIEEVTFVRGCINYKKLIEASKKYNGSHHGKYFV